VLRRGPPGLPRGARGAGRPGAGNRAGVKAEALARERSDRVGEGPGGARSLDAERSPVTDHRWRLTGRSPGGLPASNPSAARGAGSAATEAPGEPEGRDQEVSRRRADMPHLRRGELAPLVPKPPCLQTLTSIKKLHFPHGSITNSRHRSTRSATVVSGVAPIVQ
jgi:hypothetical protein